MNHKFMSTLHKVILTTQAFSKEPELNMDTYNIIILK